eukprot:Rmarinus@m.16064
MGLDGYELQKPVGSGKFSTVYRAKRLSDGLLVAIKKIEVFDIDAKTRERCLKEVKMMQSLTHPNITTYIDSMIEGNDLYIVLEWASQGDLRRLVREAAEAHSPFEEGTIWRLFAQIAEGLCYMHEKNMMHRDLKPANLFVTADRMLKLGDMGLSRQFSESTVEAYSKVGTPLYMSPEVLKGKGYDYKADIWSLGCILYELAALKSPFKNPKDQNLYTLFKRIESCNYDPLPDHLSEELRHLVSSMIQINPSTRPSASEVVAAARKQVSKYRTKVSPLVSMDGIMNKLRLLNYDVEFCAPRSLPPLTPTFFALPVTDNTPYMRYTEEQDGLSLENVQLRVFSLLVAWLLSVANKNFSADDKEDDVALGHPDAVVGRLMQKLDGLGLTQNLTPAQLRRGYGESVCYILDSLLDFTLKETRFRLEAPSFGGDKDDLLTPYPSHLLSHPEDNLSRSSPAEFFKSQRENRPSSRGPSRPLEVDIPGESESDLYGADNFSDPASFGPYDHDISVGSPVKSRSRALAAGIEGATTTSGARDRARPLPMIRSQVDAETWRAESQRLGPALMKPLVLPERNWRQSAEQFWEHAPIIQSQGVVAKEMGTFVSGKFDEELKMIGQAEAAINGKFTGDLLEIKKTRQQFDEVTKEYDAAQERVSSLSNQLQNVSEELENVNENVYLATDEASGATHIARVKEAIRNLRKETKELNLRLGTTRQRLLSRELRAAGSEPPVRNPLDGPVADGEANYVVPLSDDDDDIAQILNASSRTPDSLGDDTSRLSESRRSNKDKKCESRGSDRRSSSRHSQRKSTSRGSESRSDSRNSARVRAESQHGERARSRGSTRTGSR